MELKRIIARDTRAANEKAVALYGPDVLVISSSKVRGQTELIVAVDIAPMSVEAAVAEAFVPTEKTYALPEPAVSETPASFGQVLDQTMARQKRPAKAGKVDVADGFVPASTLKAKVVADKEPAPVATPAPVKAVAPAAQAEVQAAQEQRDMVRGKEIVDMVREELASLRKEFKLSQQMAWQGAGLSRSLLPLRNALQEAAIPAALRALLIDSIQSFEDVDPALDEIRRQLCHSMQHSSVSIPDQGVHVIAGPSGAGKSLMVARLAQHASVTLGSEQVAVISFSDQRAGAWNQTQLLSAQSGVDSFRAINIGTLKLLLEEHASRRLILIDTSGVQMQERLTEIRGLQQDIGVHAVVPVDASSATLRRMFENNDNTWSSLMLSKLDESNQPWALLQFLTEKSLPVSVASQGDRTSDLVEVVAMADLVKRALDNLVLPENTSQAESVQAASLGALTVNKLQKIAAHYQTESTGLTHE